MVSKFPCKKIYFFPSPSVAVFDVDEVALIIVACRSGRSITASGAVYKPLRMYLIEDDWKDCRGDKGLYVLFYECFHGKSNVYR